jgi:tRNA G46 methylase TrmB
MPDLDHTFDKYTEKYQADQLDRIRDYARDVELPDRISLEIGSNRGRFLV